MSCLFASGSQRMELQHQSFQWIFRGIFRVDLRLTSLISLLSKGLSRVFSNTTVQKHQLFGAQFMVQLSHPYMTTGKTIALTIWTVILSHIIGERFEEKLSELPQCLTPRKTQIHSLHYCPDVERERPIVLLARMVFLAPKASANLSKMP